MTLDHYKERIGSLGCATNIIVVLFCLTLQHGTNGPVREVALPCPREGYLQGHGTYWVWYGDTPSHYLEASAGRVIKRAAKLRDGRITLYAEGVVDGVPLLLLDLINGLKGLATLL